MIRTPRITILLRVLSSLFMTGVLSTTIFFDSHGQVRPETTMNKSDLPEAAAVLKALTADWALVDFDPEFDFLVFVDESRDELDFYPKKSLVQMMESSGLIENTDKEGSSVRQPDTHYELRSSIWKEVTVAGIIVFEYRVTPKGRKLLRDAPRLTGRPVRELRSATSPVDTRSKPLKVVTYDRPAIQKLVDAFDQKATALIEAAFSPENDFDRAASSSHNIACGPRLWRTLGPHALRNGVQRLIYPVKRTFSFGVGIKPTETETRLQDQPILGSDEALIFWKTLREEFKIEGPLAIRRASSAEWSTYPDQERVKNDDFPPPTLDGYTVFFIVEVNKSRFMVLVENGRDAKIQQPRPELTWVEIMSEK